MKGHMAVNVAPEPLKLCLIFSTLSNTSLAHSLKDGGSDSFQLIRIKRLAKRQVQERRCSPIHFMSKRVLFSHTIPKMGLTQTSLQNIPE